MDIALNSDHLNMMSKMKNDTEYILDNCRNPAVEEIKRETATVCTRSLPIILDRRKPVTLIRDDRLLSDIKQEKNIGKSYSNTPNKQKTELVLNMGKPKMYMNGSLETQYFKEDDCFEHTVIISQQEEFSESICYGKLDLRNGDRILSVNWTDVTIRTHDEVLQLLTPTYSNATPDIIQFTLAMEYIRPNEDVIIEKEFNIKIVTVNSHRDTYKEMQILKNYSKDSLKYIPDPVLELDGPPNEVSITSVHEDKKDKDEWQKVNYITAFKKKGTESYLQIGHDDNVVFKEVTANVPGAGLEYFYKGHFTEEKLLSKNKRFYYRRYQAETDNKYLYVNQNGFLELDDTFSKFRLRLENGFSIMQFSGKPLMINSKHNLEVMPHEFKSEQDVPFSCWLEFIRLACG